MRRELITGTAILGVLVVAGTAQGAGPDVWTLLSSPVRVEAKLLDGPLATVENMAHFEFLISVRDGHSNQKVGTFLIAVKDLQDALRVLRKTIVWRAPYLFVRSECGGGTAWACDREVVFRAAAGQAERVGIFGVGDERRAAMSFRRGRFIDIYDKLESAPGVAHAGAPFFNVVMTPDAEGLTVDREATWKLNQRRYRESTKALTSFLADESAEKIFPYGAAVQAAALAKYCGQEGELVRILELSEPHLSEKQRRWLSESLRIVIPSERPDIYRRSDRQTEAGLQPQIDRAHPVVESHQLLEGAYAQVGRTLSYDSTYRRIAYPGGDVPIDRGVCSDVVIRAYRAAGIDLQVLVHEDMVRDFKAYPQLWGLSAPDPNIDHRRVPNLATFLTRQGTVLPASKSASDYAPGDIVTWRLSSGVPHIGLVSDRRAGERYMVVHNIGEGTRVEDVLFDFEITGHYRYGLEPAHPS